MRTPTWMFNDRFEGGWEHVPFTIPHPLLIPSGLREMYAVVLKQSGPPEGLLRSAVRAATFLTVDQLKKIHVHPSVPYGFKTKRPWKGWKRGEARLVSRFGGLLVS